MSGRVLLPRPVLIVAGAAAVLVIGAIYLFPPPAGPVAVVERSGAVAGTGEVAGAVPARAGGGAAGEVRVAEEPRVAMGVPAAGVVPSFDVVRVGPQGNAVIAGRAAPGADVVVFDGGREVARARADRRGEFVALPAAPLAGGGELTLGARVAGGGEVKGDAAVVVLAAPVAVAPGPGTLGAGTVGAGMVGAGMVGAGTVGAGTPEVPARMAVLVPQAGPVRVLDAPRAAVSLDVVDYDAAGAIRFSGQAGGGASVRLYVDNVAVGDAVADGSGRWGLTPGQAVAAGVHSVRVDLIDGSGRVMSRVELPFQRAAVEASAVAAGRVVVQPGHNLWRLARSAYGSGVRYTVIYQANQDQIRNPRLIYPGQVFAVPGEGR